MQGSVSNVELLERCKSEMDQSGVMHHRFLTRFEERMLSREELSAFMIQWYKTATAHRRAFPGLIGNIKDDEIRFELIEILYEEYGNGDRTRIHGKLLARLLRALDLTLDHVVAVKALPAVSQFNVAISDIWFNGEHSFAFGLHFGLEYLASSQQAYCARGMRKYRFLSEEDREYFDLHAEAEIRHVAYSENGFLHYAEDEEQREKLVAGVREAIALLRALWDEFDGLLFSSVVAAEPLTLVSSC